MTIMKATTCTRLGQAELLLVRDSAATTDFSPRDRLGCSRGGRLETGVLSRPAQDSYAVAGGQTL
jgi:hypothetical protein